MTRRKKETNKKSSRLPKQFSTCARIFSSPSNHPYVVHVMLLCFFFLLPFRKKLELWESWKLQFSYPYFVGLISTPAMARKSWCGRIRRECRMPTVFFVRRNVSTACDGIPLPSPNVIAVFLLTKKFQIHTRRWLLLWGVDSRSRWNEGLRAKKKEGEERFLNVFAFGSEQCRSIERCRNNIEHCCGLTTAEKRWNSISDSAYAISCSSGGERILSLVGAEREEVSLNCLKRDSWVNSLAGLIIAFSVGDGKPDLSITSPRNSLIFYSLQLSNKQKHSQDASHYLVCSCARGRDEKSKRFLNDLLSWSTNAMRKLKRLHKKSRKRFFVVLRIYDFWKDELVKDNYEASQAADWDGI